MKRNQTGLAALIVFVFNGCLAPGPANAPYMSIWIGNWVKITFQSSGVKTNGSVLIARRAKPISNSQAGIPLIKSSRGLFISVKMDNGRRIHSPSILFCSSSLGYRFFPQNFFPFLANL
jgi:hypothetical protein